MARIRTIKPDFWEDETIASLTRDARLLFIATFNMADDEGLLRWSPSYVKAQAFIYDEDVTVEFTEQLMEELTEAGLIYAYTGGKTNQRLGMIVNFRKHQKVNRPQPSKLPAPSLQNAGVRQMYAHRDDWTCHLCKGVVNETPQKDERFNLSLDHLDPRSDGGDDYPSNVRLAHLSCNKSRKNAPLTIEGEPDTEDVVNDSVNRSVSGSRPEGEGEQGTGKGKEKTPSSPARKRAATRLPHDWTPTDRHEEYARKNGLALDREVFKFRNHAEAKDRRQADWHAAFNNWLANAVDWSKPKQQPTGTDVPFGRISEQ